MLRLPFCDAPLGLRGELCAAEGLRPLSRLSASPFADGQNARMRGPLQRSVCAEEAPFKPSRPSCGSVGGSLAASLKAGGSSTWKECGELLAYLVPRERLALLGHQALQALWECREPWEHLVRQERQELWVFPGHQVQLACRAHQASRGLRIARRRKMSIR